MKVTKYPHRYTISLSEVEFRALRELSQRGMDEFGYPHTYPPIPPAVVKVIKSERWTAKGGPLSIDVEKQGRGGSA